MGEKIKQSDISLLVRHGFPSAVIDTMHDLTKKQIDLLKKISVGPYIGQKFSPVAWQQKMLPLAMALSERYQADNIRLWYDRCDLNDHLGFDVGLDHYEVVCFKKFDLFKNHNTEVFETKNFADADSVLRFFHDGKYMDWLMLLKTLTHFEIGKILIDSNRERISRLFQGFNDLVVPTLFNSGGSYFLAESHKMHVRWRMNISEQQGVCPVWRVFKPGHHLVVQALHFTTALQYALQVWNWLGDSASAEKENAVS